MRETFIISAVRTPIGKFLGSLSSYSGVKLGSLAIAEAVRRAGLDGSAIDEVVLGQVVQAGAGQAPARQAALGAGIAEDVPAYTVNMVCGSGLKAVMLASQAIAARDADCLVAGGMESMSNAPFLLPQLRKGHKYGDTSVVDALIRDGLWCSFEQCGMGDLAEYTASRWGISRGDQDRFSSQSHARAFAAWERGDFTAEVVPVPLAGGGPGAAEAVFERDEGIRADTSPERLAKLKPSFRGDGTVTAGNSSQLSDGAAAVVLTSERGLKRCLASPLARVIAYAQSALPPKDLFIAPVAAIRKVLEKAHLSAADIDLYEINEAFAAQLLACTRECGLDEAKVNVNGGAIALGHPIGASGARVLTTLIHALHHRKLRYGLAALCLGGGSAVAMIVERV